MFTVANDISVEMTLLIHPIVPHDILNAKQKRAINFIRYPEAQLLDVRNGWHDDSF